MAESVIKNADVVSNLFDGNVNIANNNSNPYPSTSPYTCPCNGYLKVSARSSGNEAFGQVYDKNGILIVELNICAAGTYGQMSSVFVYKGMKVSGNVLNATHSNTFVSFVKLKE